MSNMIINILTTIGITYLITESNLLITQRAWIAGKHRLLAELFYCPICMSFWVGLIITGDILQAFAIMGVVSIISIWKK